MVSAGEWQDQDERTMAMAENHWLAAQIRPYRRRLIGFGDPLNQ
jgi:hypothetical protein